MVRERFVRQTRVAQGLVRGIPASDPRITVFKGIPYAEPPIGSLRWRPPQRKQAWRGVYDASEFGPIPIQPRPFEGGESQFYNREWHVDPGIPMSEDCLYLNVWTPAKSVDEKLPVFVWIYGGGYQVGYTSEMEFDGERFARRGVIFVSMNYRENVFGFMTSSDIANENPEAPANFGLLDQLEALHWVHENIESFGGDPENVTLGGQSAGGGSTLIHLLSEQSQPYFRRAILQSGGSMAALSKSVPRLDEGKATGDAFLKNLDVYSMEEARRIPSLRLWQEAIIYPHPEDAIANWVPIVDGQLLQDQPSKMLKDSRIAKIPVLMGFTKDEFIEWPDGDLEAFADKLFHDKASEFLSLLEQSTRDYEETEDLAAIHWLDVGMRKFANTMAVDYELPVYLYEFGPEIPGDDAGAFHSSDLWFSFETLAKSWRPFEGAHYDLARKMCHYWSNFVKTGDPNGPDSNGQLLPRWEAYTESEPYCMVLNLTPGMSRDGLHPVQEFILQNLTLE